MDARDIFFAEVCDGKLDREPFVLESPRGTVTVYAEEIDDANYLAWQEEIAKQGGDPDSEEVDCKSKARLIVRCVVDESGKLFFSRSDVDRLAKGRVRYVDPLYQLCLKVNRLGSFANLKKKSDGTVRLASCSEPVGNGESEISAVSLAK